MAATSLAAGVGILAGATACSSSKGSPADAGFGSDAGSPKDTGTTAKPDTGTTPVDAGPPPPAGDGGCGSAGGNSWCAANAPMPTVASNVLCDDFDTGLLSSAFGWTGLTGANLVNTEYVSPYCAVRADIGDAGAAGAAQGAFTDHSYDSAPTSGTAKLAFDLWVPGGSSCEGAAVAYFVARQAPSGASPTGAIESWLIVSGIQGTGGAATGYTVSLASSAGPYPLGRDGGAQPTAPVTVQVTPRASDKGWARLELDVSAYVLATAPTDSTASATVSWFTIGGTAAQSTSTATAASGPITSTGTTTLSFDVGLLPDPMSEMALAACQLYIDDFVSDYSSK